MHVPFHNIFFFFFSTLFFFLSARWIFISVVFFILQLLLFRVFYFILFHSISVPCFSFSFTRQFAAAIGECHRCHFASFAWFRFISFCVKSFILRFALFPFVSLFSPSLAHSPALSLSRASICLFGSFPPVGALDVSVRRMNIYKRKL